MSLDKIPWQNTQADWFGKLIDDNKITGKTALDLGCGTGKKSIHLANHGFEKVIGVDISPTAIKYAKQNSLNAKADNKTEFLVHDATDLSFLGDQKFDFILDWANIHGLPKDKLEKYIIEIAKHSHCDTIFLLRSFASGIDKDTQFESRFDDEMRVNELSENTIKKLISPYFYIVDFSKSTPQTNDGKNFIEYLMKKKDSNGD